MTILVDIQKLLEENDLPCHLREATEDIPYERLLVALPASDQNETLEISAHPQYDEKIYTKEKQTDAYYLVQFQHVLSVSATLSTFNQISNSLHLVNRLIHCPGFELDELSDKILYRYVWFIKKNGIDAFLLMQVIGNLQLYIKMFSPFIKEIAEGHYTLEDILTKAIELSKQILTT